MKALTLWQPWAQLIAVGAKKVETRSWRPPASLGRLVICSAKRSLRVETDVADAAAKNRIYAALARHSGPLRYGAALCVVTVISVQHVLPLTRTLSEDELAFGDYSRGRFGWVLGDLRAFARPFPVCGRQGLFDVPDYLVAEALAA
jgi:hypothetical protein